MLRKETFPTTTILVIFYVSLSVTDYSSNDSQYKVDRDITNGITLEPMTLEEYMFF